MNKTFNVSKEFIVQSADLSGWATAQSSTVAAEQRVACNPLQSTPPRQLGAEDSFLEVAM